MRRTRWIVLAALTVTIVVLFGVKLIYRPAEKSSPVIQTVTQTQIITLAQKLYQDKKAQGTDFKQGPCLSNQLAPDWVADIAHQPRLPIDDLPQNQCPAFRSGQAHHFVELDPNGNVIRIY
ncbi:hypothetical protein M1523_04210 [Patescibacteria group bacterium]|nr:hypothetical protein [Patescibacteria group bacterium]MCL5091892.1 hypothetical protein [Patescibacteria group bacterium]